MFLLIITNPLDRVMVADVVDNVLCREFDFRLVRDSISSCADPSRFAFTFGSLDCTATSLDSGEPADFETCRVHRNSDILRVADWWVFDIHVSTLALDDLSAELESLFDSSLLYFDVSIRS